MTSDEKFEILSAYLDDEASQEERRLVEQWIECDPLFRQQYHAQLTLRSAVRSLPASFFDIAIATENRTADNHAATEQTESEQTESEQTESEQTESEQTNLKQTKPEQSAYPIGLDDLKPEGLSIRTALPIDSIAIASQWKNLLIIATVLSATALTTLSYGSIRSSQESQLQRPSGRITEIR